MPGKTVKDVYVGKTIADLNKLAEDIPKGSHPRVVIKSAQKLFMSAEDFDKQGDEEKAYILYMRFFNMITEIKKHADYKKSETYYKSIISQKDLIKAIDQAEKLSTSLKHRYEEKEAKEVSKKLATLDGEKKEEERLLEEEKSKREEEEKEKKAKEESAKLSVKPAGPGVVSVQQLYSMLMDKDANLIIMDIRTPDQFEASHIKHKCCINIPSVKPGSTVVQIGQNLPQASVELWRQRGTVEHIILLDWHCTTASLQTGTVLKSLKDALFKFDSTVIIKSEPLILEGGYGDWLNYYPTMTTNASVRPPSYGEVSTKVPSLHNISYDLDMDFLKSPEKEKLPDIIPVMNNQVHQPSQIQKPQSNTAAPGMPFVDRSLKPKDGNVPQNNMTGHMENNIAKPGTGRTINGEKPRNIQTVNNDLGSSVPHSKNSNLDASRSNVATVSPVVKPSVNGNLHEASAELASQIEDLHVKQQKKQNELHDIQEVKEVQTKRLDKLRGEERQLEELESKKQKEVRETAELLRKKKKIQDEIRQLEEEKTSKLEEEQKRHHEIDVLKEEEAVKLKRQQEVQRIREERLRKEKEQTEKIAAEKMKKLQEEKEKQEIAAAAEAKAQKEQALKEEQEQDAQERAKKEAVEKLQAEKEKAERERIERERVEKERKDAAEAAAREVAKAAEQAKIEAKKRDQVDRVMVGNMPAGWEKKLDHATGRYYFIDHNTHTTHWTPPTSRTNSPKKEPHPTTASGTTHHTKLKDESDSGGSGGLKRSHSSPNIAKLVQDENQSPVTATLDRSNKPRPRIQVAPREVSAAKVRNLQPTWGSVDAALTGLRNQGNTCYMNSIIQCLSNCAILTAYFRTDSYVHDLIQEKNKGEITEEFAVVIKALWSRQYRSITPRDFKITVGRHHSFFAGYDQQDAQEFLLFLMDGLHEDLNKEKKRKHIPEQENEGIPDEPAAQKAWNNYKSANKSIIVDSFQGQFKSTVQCLVCGKKSVMFEAFQYLPLEIPNPSRCSLRDCLLQYSKETKMTGESKWKCPKCNKYQEAVQRAVLWKLPPILMIVLKRFYYQGMWRQKITSQVDFPVEDLDMNKFISGPDKRMPYQLFAVSNHYGTMEGGHYTAFSKNPMTHRWYKYDDHEVYDMSKSDIKSSAAYILFYSSVPFNYKA